MLTRPFAASDVEAVARLSLRTQRRDAAPSRRLCETIQRLYLGHPSQGSAARSLVIESSAGITGFLGVIPVPMTYRGRQVDAVVGASLLIRPDITHPFVSSRLLRDFFDGPHELAMTATSNETVRRFWQANDSLTLHAMSRQWLQVLRPAQFVASASRLPARLNAPLALRRPRALTASASSGIRSVPLTAPLLAKAVDQLAGDRVLCFDIRAESLEWMWDVARGSAPGNRLVGTAVYEGSDLAGWSLYDPNPGRIAQVLQVAARPGSGEVVLDHLFQDALRRGSIAVTGRVPPQLIGELGESGCIFVEATAPVQVSSKNRDLLHALHRGDVLLPGIEGERWLQLPCETSEPALKGSRLAARSMRFAATVATAPGQGA